MLKCKEATVLISKSMDLKLGLIQRSRLKLHLMRCSGCKAYKKQLLFIQRSSQKYYLKKQEIES